MEIKNVGFVVENPAFLIFRDGERSMIRRKKHRLCPEWVQIKMLFPAKQNLFENMHYDKMKKNGDI